jgi:hypothetical protein
MNQHQRFHQQQCYVIFFASESGGLTPKLWPFSWWNLMIKSVGVWSNDFQTDPLREGGHRYCNYCLFNGHFGDIAMNNLIWGVRNSDHTYYIYILHIYYIYILHIYYIYIYYIYITYIYYIYIYITYIYIYLFWHQTWRWHLDSVLARVRSHGKLWRRIQTVIGRQEKGSFAELILVHFQPEAAARIIHHSGQGLCPKWISYSYI